MKSNRVSYLKGINKLVVPTSKGLQFIPLGDVTYIRAENINAVLQTEIAEIFVFSTLLSLEKILQGKFVRVHKSFLVNLDMIEMYKKSDGGSITLSNGTTIPLSRQKRTLFLKDIGLK